MSHLLAAALHYAELGYRVFPCVPGRKSPLTPAGFHNATTDADEIQAWWATYPLANIGLATTDLVVIDVDGQGFTWHPEHSEYWQQLAQGAVAVTPRGGRHYYFRLPTDKSYRCSSSRLAPGIDVRTTGGYVLVAPSLVAGQSYQWGAGLALDCALHELPVPPDWLCAELDQWSNASPTRESARTVTNVAANTIPLGQRNATLASLAGTMRRVGMTQREIVSALVEVNAQRCAPPLDNSEVTAIAGSVTRYAPDQVATAIAEHHYEQVFGTAEPRFPCYTSPQLEAAQFPLTYLVDGILVAGQPALIAAPKKSLKTNLSIDLALALAQGGLFLRRFDVPRAVRVGIMSGESGPATIQETARRIAASKGQSLADYANAIWSFDLPQLGSKLDIAALRDFILVHGLEVIILDPAYLMMPGVGDNAGNLFVVGEYLKPISELAQATGCTPILCHHLKKALGHDIYEPPELENITWAGFQEWARQWILLNRRVRYDPDQGGHHELWMSVGGSAGHSGAWGINIDEGTHQDQGGRYWEVEIVSAQEVYAQRAAQKDESREQHRELRQSAKTERHRTALLGALAAFPDGETISVLRTTAKLTSNTAHELLQDLLEAGEVETCTVQKHTRNETAYRRCNAARNDRKT